MSEAPKDLPGPSGDLQFEQAEYAAPGAAESSCAVCNQEISSRYYQINGKVICETCREKLAASRTGGGPGRFLRALIFGSGAAIAGAVIYYIIVALTGYELGLVTLVIGLMVGRAVKAGCRAHGGWLYQGLAVLLTYCAVVAIYVPLILHAVAQHKDKAGEAGAATKQADKPRDAVANPSPDAGRPTARELGPVRFLDLLVALALLLALAFITPFLLGAQNIIGLIIIAVGLYEAWKINQRPRLVVTGPYQLSATGGSTPEPQSRPDHA